MANLETKTQETAAVHAPHKTFAPTNIPNAEQHQAREAAERVEADNLVNELNISKDPIRIVTDIENLNSHERRFSNFINQIWETVSQNWKINAVAYANKYKDIYTHAVQKLDNDKSYNKANDIVQKKYNCMTQIICQMFYDRIYLNDKHNYKKININGIILKQTPPYIQQINEYLTLRYANNNTNELVSIDNLQDLNWLIDAFNVLHVFKDDGARYTNDESDTPTFIANEVEFLKNNGKLQTKTEVTINLDGNITVKSTPDLVTNIEAIIYKEWEYYHIYWLEDYHTDNVATIIQLAGRLNQLIYQAKWKPEEYIASKEGYIANLQRSWKSEYNGLKALEFNDWIISNSVVMKIDEIYRDYKDLISKSLDPENFTSNIADYLNNKAQ